MAAAISLDPEAAADLGALRARLDTALAASPLPIARARALAAAYQAYVDTVTRTSRAATRPAPRTQRPSA
jgi:hypothetical protein